MAGETLDSRRALFVISGPQGAGKSTVAGLLARRFARGAHIEADTLQKMIVSGCEWPDASTVSRESPHVTGEAGEQLRLRLHNMCLLGRSFYEAGFAAVLDDIIVGEQVHELREELSDVPFFFVRLAPGLEAVRAREQQRGTRLWPEWEWLSEAALEPIPFGLRIDSSGQTPAETIDEIMRRAWNEALVVPEAVTARSAP